MFSLSRPSLGRLLFAAGLVLPVLADSVSLTQFQQINGFPSACTQAYDSTIQGCTTNDFTNNNACSAACVTGLEALTELINEKCAGISTSPNTLIGLFFEGKGVQALCPSVASTTSSAAPSSSQKASSAAASTTKSSSASQQSSSAAASTAATSAPATTTSPSPTTMSTSAVSTMPTFTLSGSSTASASASTSSSTSAENNGDSFGGDINPFSSTGAASGLESSRVLMSMVVVGLALGWLM